MSTRILLNHWWIEMS